MFEYPERKVVLYTIPTTHWKLTCRIKQTNAEKTNDYFNILKYIKSWKLERMDILSDMFYKEIENNVISYQKPKYIRKTKVLSLIKGDISAYYSDIATIMHKQRESKYSDIPPPIRKDEIKKGRRKQLFQADLELIYEKTGISVDMVEKTLTSEQIGRWMDKIRFDYYETFDEWRIANNKVKARMGLSDWQKDLLAEIKANSKEK